MDHLAIACLRKCENYQTKSDKNYFSRGLCSKPIYQGLGTPQASLWPKHDLRCPHNFSGALTASFFFEVFWLVGFIPGFRRNRDHPLPLVVRGVRGEGCNFFGIRQMPVIFTGLRGPTKTPSSRKISKIEAPKGGDPPSQPATQPPTQRPSDPGTHYFLGNPTENRKARYFN